MQIEQAAANRLQNGEQPEKALSPSLLLKTRPIIVYSLMLQTLVYYIRLGTVIDYSYIK